MTRPLLVLVALLAVLVAWDGWLVQRDRAERRQSSRIERLVPATSGRTSLAVVRLQTGAGENFTYGRKGGLWRCLSWRGAIASRSGIESLVYGLLDAQGVIVSEDPEHPADYGLDVPAMTTVNLHGPQWSPQQPQSDPIASFDLGTVLPEGGGSFVRRRGERAVWAIDGNPGLSLERERGARRPPLIDPRLVPADWPGGSPRLATVRVEHAGGEAFELHLEEVPLTSAQAQAGVPPFEWTLRRGDSEVRASQLVAISYVNFLLEADWQDIVDPALAQALGLEHPRATLLLSGAPGAPPDTAPDSAPDATPDGGGESDLGEPLRLGLGGKAPSGRPTVIHSLARLIYELDPAAEALMFPQAEAFAEDTPVNPWER